MRDARLTLRTFATLANAFFLLLMSPGLASADDMSPGLASADDPKTACIDASEEGQVLRDQGKLLEARERFLTCSAEACPKIVRVDCASWLEKLEEQIPSVVFSARDPKGQDISDVRVELDGKPLLERLDGKSVQLNPGEHQLRYVWAKAAPIEQRIILREGERHRALEVRFRAPPAPIKVENPSIPASFWILGALGIGGAGAFAGLGIVAKNEADDLRVTCAPRCEPDKVDPVRAKVIAANIALGAGIAALGAATIVFITRPKAPAPPPVSVSFAPAPGGGVAVVGGRFSL